MRPLLAGHFRCQFPSRSPSARERIPKGDHVTPASARCVAFPIVPAAGTLSAPASQPVPFGMAALHASGGSQLAHTRADVSTIAAPDRVLSRKIFFTDHRCPVVTGGVGALHASITQQRPASNLCRPGQGLGTAGDQGKHWLKLRVCAARSPVEREQVRRTIDRDGRGQGAVACGTSSPSHCSLARGRDKSKPGAHGV
jgi:hypothetical protein